MKQTFSERTGNFFKKLISIKIILGIGIPTVLLLVGLLSEGLWLVAFFSALGFRSLEKIAPGIKIGWNKDAKD